MKMCTFITSRLFCPAKEIRHRLVWLINVQLMVLLGIVAVPLPGQGPASQETFSEVKARKQVLSDSNRPAKPILEVSAPAIFAPWATYCGQYQGISAYSNGYPDYYGPNDTYKWRYLCIEYVNRFYAQVFPHQNMSWVYAAYDYYKSYQQLGLDRYPNGGTVPPQPGDLLCSDGGRWGHVAIVREVGSNYLKLIQQNWYQDGRDSAMTLTLTYSGGHYTLAPFSSVYPIQGWLRKPGMTFADLDPCEDHSPEFTRYGTAGRWHELVFDPYCRVTADSSIGVCRNHMWWVYSNGSSRDNYAIWRPSLSRSGYYDIFAFIPSINGTTQTARYEVHHANGTTLVTINQNIYYGVFVSLGSNYRFNAGSEGYILLGDDTGEPPGSKMVAFDNVLFVYRGSTTVADLRPSLHSSSSKIQAQPNPFDKFTCVRGQEGNTFALYDLTGRLKGLYKGHRIGADAAPGIYFLKPEGKGVTPVRVVKVR